MSVCFSARVGKQIIPLDNQPKKNPQKQIAIGRALCRSLSLPFVLTAIVPLCFSLFYFSDMLGSL